MSLVDDTFKPGGYLASLFPGYEPRASQVKLAAEIERAIRDGENLLAEAGTGTGKSVAYLVPAIEHAIRSGTRALVVTANIVLQEQLVRKDLPQLRAILPTPFEFGLAKGRAQYLCIDRLEESQAERAIMAGARGEENFPAIVEWAARTEHGDLSELPFEPTPALRRLFTVSAEECLGSACPRKEECFPNKARAKLASAQVMVANYHLFFSDLVVRASTDGEVRILPEFDVLILDEAHNAPTIARDFFGFRHTAGSVRWALRLLGGSPGKHGNGEIPEIDVKLRGRVQDEADAFFERLARYAKSEAYKARLRVSDPVPSASFVEVLAEAEGLLERTAAVAALDAAARKKLRQAATQCSTIGAHVAAAMRPAEDKSSVFFIDEDRNSGRAAICSKPIDVDGTLRARVFDAPELRSTIVTSATLTTDDKDGFDFIAGELGAEGARELAVESPFDFAGRCLFVVPEDFDICLPGERSFVEESAKLFARVAELARGRTLGLFTTHKAMQAAYEAAARGKTGERFNVFCQGQAPRSELVRRFKEDVSSVLVGTASLWEGVDVPGEALSCVVMDKLPFPTPDDPVLDALDARDRDAFSRHSLPRALIAFRQGFGRLIRSSTDRGVVVCFDRRIFEKPYGRRFLKALPRGVRVSHDLEDVRRFLDGEMAERALVTPKQIDPSPEADAGPRQRLRRKATGGACGECKLSGAHKLDCSRNPDRQASAGMTDAARAAIAETIRKATGG